ncbi:MAG: VOC family protein [Trueperaceae bacterium]|nr:VOC family protein [Trueperaceae bacterium]
MQLSFVYVPVTDLAEALALYRDLLGFEQVWQEGEFVAGLDIPDSDVQIMLEQDPTEVGKPGPIFVVDSVDAFYAEHAEEMAFVVVPQDIPPGRYAAFDDPSGNRVRILDTSKEP